MRYGPALTCLAALMGAGDEARAELSLTLMQPGAGFLVGDSRSLIPLELDVREDAGAFPLRAAGVKAARGKVSDIRVMSAGRISFLYRPVGGQGLEETLSFTLEKKGGERVLLDLSFELPEPSAPRVALELSPTQLETTGVEPVDVAVTVTEASASATRLQLSASHGRLTGPERPVRGDGRVQLARRFEPPADLPDDAPSHLLLLATAADEAGFGASATGLPVIAPLRLSAEVPAGHRLVLEGAEARVAPVKAAADGRTVIEGRARYGAPVRAFIQRGKKRKEIPIAVPSGFVPLALALPLPGQNVADGGTGPTLAVALPPAPLGAELYWPEISVEGATLVDALELEPDLRVLVLQRPQSPGPVSVLVDGTPLSTIPFVGAHGRSLVLEEAVSDRGERAALELRVTDAAGNPTDTPTPRVRLASGFELRLERSGVGTYRVMAPPNTPGDTGDEVEVVAELPSPRVIAGDPAELASTRARVRLEGPAPAVRADEGPSAGPPRPSVSGIPLRIGFSALALAGTTFGSHILFGGAAAFELRMPFYDRLLLRVGFEFYRGTGRGTVRFLDAQALEAASTLGGTIIPIELGFVFLDTRWLELMVRGGLGIRSESAALEVGGDRAGGGSLRTAAARAALEAGFYLGPGTVNLGLTLDGIGASARDLSADRVTFEGSLTNLRLDLGYRIWL